MLYAIGTDQIKGFAVTLILGIVMSMFTAIFCSRLVFDIAERNRWITQLKMAHLHRPAEHRLPRQRPASPWPSRWCSSLVGLVGVFARGIKLLDIDFTGGASVELLFDPEHPQDIAEVAPRRGFRRARQTSPCRT